MKLPLAAAAATGIQVGATLVASAAVVADVGSGLLGFLRYAIALLFLMPFVMASKAPAVERRHFLPIALIGIGQFGVLIALLHFSLLYISSARAALVFATLPVLTLIVSAALARTSPGIRALGPILLTILGIACLLGPDALSGGFAGGELIGLTAVFAATLTGAICSVLYRPYLERYGVVRTSALAMAASLPPLAVLAFFEPGGLALSAWPNSIYVLVGLIGLSSGIGYQLWLYALSRIDAARVTAFMALNPLTAAILSAWLLDEPVTSGLVLAIALVSCGLFVLARSARS